MNQVLNSFVKKNDSKTTLWHTIIQEMLDSGSYDYAEETLYDIQQYIEFNHTISDKQIQAVKNIKNKPSYSDWDSGYKPWSEN